MDHADKRENPNYNKSVLCSLNKSTNMTKLIWVGANPREYNPTYTQGLVYPV
jgi:hypothetical protein